MSEPLPILLAIHDEFDTFDRYPHTNHSEITSIKVQPTPDGYRYTTYPGGSGAAYDSFVLNVTATDGMFSSVSDVTRVEASRDSGGIMRLQVEEELPVDRGLVASSSTVSKPAKREGLILPGDEGFDLIEVLHEDTKDLKPHFVGILNLLGIDMELIGFGLNQKMRGIFYNHNEQIARHDRTDTYTMFGGQDAIVSVALDATTTIPFDEPGPQANTPTVYRLGALSANNENVEARALSMEELLAFSWLAGEVGKLYR